MSRGGWVLAVIVALIIWHDPTGAAHFVSQTWDKASTFLGAVFH